MKTNIKKDNFIKSSYLFKKTSNNRRCLNKKRRYEKILLLKKELEFYFNNLN